MLEEDLTELKRHAMPINFRNEGGASLHPGGKRFIAGGSDLWVRVFDYDTGAELECLKVRIMCEYILRMYILVETYEVRRSCVNFPCWK